MSHSTQADELATPCKPCLVTDSQEFHGQVQRESRQAILEGENEGQESAAPDRISKRRRSLHDELQGA